MVDKIPLPGFNYSLCTACEVCVQVCPEGALAMDNGLPQVRPGNACTYCGLCEDSCPTGAIYLSYEITLGIE